MRIAVLFAVALVPVLSAQTPTLRPGQYELVSEFSMPGRPAGLPGRKDLHCYTAQELQDLGNSVAKTNASQNCKVLDSKTVGPKMTFTTECANANGNRMTSSGEVNVLSQDSYRVVVNMKTPTSPDGTTITINAKRIGDCTK